MSATSADVSKRPTRGERSSRKGSRSGAQAETRPAPKSKPMPAATAQPKRDRRAAEAVAPSSDPRPQWHSSASARVKAGSGARIIAPVALIVFAIACFTVLTSQDSDSTTKSPEKAAATKAAATAAAAKSGPTRTTYRVKSGDSFAAIAEKHRASTSDAPAAEPGH